MNAPMTKFAIMRANREKLGQAQTAQEKYQAWNKIPHWVPPWSPPSILIDGSEEQTVTHEVIPRTEAT